MAHIDAREYWCRKFKKKPIASNLDKKLEAIKLANVLEASLKRSYVKESLNRARGDMKKTWKLLKEFWPSSSKKSNIKEMDGYNTNVDKAECFNKYFSTIGSTLADKIPYAHPIYPEAPHLPSVFGLHEISLLELSLILRDLKPFDSCGVDGLTWRLLKAAGPSILPPLSHLINSSIRQRIFSMSWKDGCVTPLNKDGPKSSPSNCHPITVLPCLEKILEKVIHSQVYLYLENKDILSTSQ